MLVWMVIVQVQVCWGWCQESLRMRLLMREDLSFLPPDTGVSKRRESQVSPPLVVNILTESLSPSNYVFMLSSCLHSLMIGKEELKVKGWYHPQHHDEDWDKKTRKSWSRNSLNLLRNDMIMITTVILLFMLIPAYHVVDSLLLKSGWGIASKW